MPTTVEVYEPTAPTDPGYLPPAQRVPMLLASAFRQK
jgi:hypothetical protein